LPDLIKVPSYSTGVKAYGKGRPIIELMLTLAAIGTFFSEP
jgi:hypothetical protein